MGTCLVTTLKEAVYDDSLLKIGEMRFVTLGNGDSLSHLSLNQTESYNNTLTIIGDGYFTDSTGASNLGKTKTFSASTTTEIYLSGGKYEVRVANKYKLKGIVTYIGEGQRNLQFDIDSLVGCVGLQYFQNNNSRAIGDLKSISHNTGILKLLVSNTNVTGELKDLQLLSRLQELSLSGTAVTGDTSDLAGLTNLTTFNYTNTAITGTWPLT